MLIKKLDDTHPLYEAKHMGKLTALYEGGKAWHSKAKDWIPRNYAEEEGLYQDRLSRALYTNHVGPIVDLMASWLFETPPGLADAPDTLAKVVDNADGNGTPSSAFFREVFLSALLVQDSYVWVNLPSKEAYPDLSSRLEEEQLGLRQPFLVHVKAENVIDWEEDDRGGLKWVMIKDVSLRRSDPTAGGRQAVHRWTLIDDTSVRRWEWSNPQGRDPQPNDDAAQTLDISHGMGALPVIKYSLKPGLWAMEKLCDPAISLLRSDNDLAWALHKAAHALLVIGLGPDQVDEGQNGVPVIGPGYAATVESGGKMEYIEPPGRSFATLREHKKDAKDDLFRVVHQMAMGADSNNAGRQVSGASKSRDMEALQIVMSDYSRTMLDFIKAVLSMAGQAAGEGSFEVVVDGLNSWKRRTLAEFLEAAALSVGAQTMSATFSREVAKKQATLILGEDIDAKTLDAIHAEIDEAEPFGANMSILGKALGDDVAASATGGADSNDQERAQPGGKKGTQRAT